MCPTKKRPTHWAPGNVPPHTRLASHVPTTGIDSAIEYPMRSPTPDSRSSISE